jgi:hypothetical protein
MAYSFGKKHNEDHHHNRSLRYGSSGSIHQSEAGASAAIHTVSHAHIRARRSDIDSRSAW